MSQTHALHLVPPNFAPWTADRAVAGFARALRTTRVDWSGAISGAATLTKLVFAHFIGLAFVLTLPFAGIAALSWFAAKAWFAPKA